MMPTYEERLTNELILRTVRDERDIERFAAFHTLVNDATQGQTCANLLRHHPEITYDDFLLIEDERSGAIVSTICLIPWQCRYEEIPLQVAMLEMVVTHPDYRQRGLVRTLIGRFHQIVNQRHVDFSIIEGIPYYYRQFGYAYAGDHWRSDRLPVGRIPALAPAVVARYALRPATVADIPRLVELYAQSNANLQLATLRDADYWRFLLAAEQYPVQIVEDQDQAAVGYLCCLAQPGGRSVKIIESSLATPEMALAVLAQVKTVTTQEIQLGWPENSTLVQLGRTLGSTPSPADQWLIRLPDVAAFLTRIGPVLARRLAASVYAGTTMTLSLNLFRHAYQLQFVAGKLQQVANIGFVDASMGADGGDLCIPPDAFVRLLFGYRTLDELSDAWPDIVVKPASRHLVEVLFPKLHGYFWMPYLYCGPQP